MGCEPKLLAGYVPIEGARAQFETAWQTPLPTHSGLNMIEMLDAATKGKMKGYY